VLSLCLKPLAQILLNFFKFFVENSEGLHKVSRVFDKRFEGVSLLINAIHFNLESCVDSLEKGLLTSQLLSKISLSAKD